MEEIFGEEEEKWITCLMQKYISMQRFRGHLAAWNNGFLDIISRLAAGGVCGRNREPKKNMYPSLSMGSTYRSSVHTKNEVHTTAPTVGTAGANVRHLRSRSSWRLRSAFTKYT